MSFWKSLFGGGGNKQARPTAPARTAEHNGYRIEAMPYPEEGQFQVSGVISKEVDGVVKRHKFVRADRFPTLDDAAEFSIVKAKQIIEQQGEKLFD